MKKTFKNLQSFKAEMKDIGIRTKIVDDIIILFPTSKYAKKYCGGDTDCAVEDLKTWYGLIGRIKSDGTVETFVGEEEND